MNEEIFNMQLRKFLKNVGITSQRKIEAAVRNAIESGTINESDSINATVNLTVKELDLETQITGRIELN